MIELCPRFRRGTGCIRVGTTACCSFALLPVGVSMEHGMVTNWADMEKIWSGLYEKVI